MGKNFAINEIKVSVSLHLHGVLPWVFIVPSWLQVVLSVLVRHFSFELPDGPSTKLGTHRSLTVRPKVAGEEDAKVPLIVRRVEQ